MSATTESSEPARIPLWGGTREPPNIGVDRMLSWTGGKYLPILLRHVVDLCERSVAANGDRNPGDYKTSHPPTVTADGG